MKAAVRPLYLALMNLIGGAAAGLGLLGLYVVALPIRRGVPYAATALTLVYALALVMAAITAETLRSETGAPVAWYNMGVLLALTLLALGAHALSERQRRRAAAAMP